MKRFKLNNNYYYCPVDLTLSIIGGKWKGLVLWSLRDEPKRFSELKRNLVKINDKMLTQVLRELEEHKIISRKVYSVVPPKVEYSLTHEGKKLIPIMKLMSNYGTRFMVK